MPTFPGRGKGGRSNLDLETLGPSTLVRSKTGLAVQLQSMRLASFKLSPNVLVELGRCTATGPDEASRQMLLDMFRDLVCHILEVYEYAEETGQWPVQAMDAIVTAVAKVEDAQRVTHYRPINILSLCYRIYSTIRTRQALRIYSTIRTRQALRFLAAQAPDTLLGMLPHRSAQQVWYAMQLQVEITRMLGGVLCGVSADLRKAFSLIPRLPILACSIKLGLPVRLVRAWTGAPEGLRWAIAWDLPCIP